MTIDEIISKYLELESQLDVQQTLIDTAQDHYNDLMAAQCELATQHLDTLTPLRAGQVIEFAKWHSTDGDHGAYQWSDPPIYVQVVEIQMLIVDAETRKPEIAAWCLGLRTKCDICGPACHLDLQPGQQWRYPTDSTTARAVAPQEVRS